jgi:uncharacterized surface protein with fasciclin (FAS1) repeats
MKLYQINMDFMKINFSTQISKKLLLLTTVLGISTLSISPTLADNHTDSMEESEQMEMPMGESNTDAGSIVEVASGNSSFSTLVKAVEAAGLADTLADSSSSYTVFAPTDEAFNQLPEGTLEYLLKPENKEVLKQVLLYHVVPNKVTSSEISGGTVDTLNGGVSTAITDSGVVINNASVIAPDVEASNGVIHGINRVLLSSELQTALASALGITEAAIYQ